VRYDHSRVTCIECNTTTHYRRLGHLGAYRILASDESHPWHLRPHICTVSNQHDLQHPTSFLCLFHRRTWLQLLPTVPSKMTCLIRGGQLKLISDGIVAQDASFAGSLKVGCGCFFLSRSLKVAHMCLLPGEIPSHKLAETNLSCVCCTFVISPRP
jgi:hypothetical protein